jgi:hypothetical protein
MEDPFPGRHAFRHRFFNVQCDLRIHSRRITCVAIRAGIEATNPALRLGQVNSKLLFAYSRTGYKRSIPPAKISLTCIAPSNIVTGKRAVCRTLLAVAARLTQLPGGQIVRCDLRHRAGRPSPRGRTGMGLEPVAAAQLEAAPIRLSVQQGLEWFLYAYRFDRADARSHS